MYNFRALRRPELVFTLFHTGHIVTNSQGSISRWNFITLTVQYTTLDYSSQLF
jgi:hypothetical protein